MVMAKSSKHDGITNRILLALPPSTLERIAPALEQISTENGQVIDHVDGPIEYMYFVNRGLVSVVKTMQDGRTVEIGAVGVEGITDANALFGIGTAVLETIVQIPGSALRVRRDTLRQEMERDDALRIAMQDYARFAFGQLAQTAACNRLHSLEERCCRWLLIAHDSALSNTFPLTHEFLAMMLGVQRSGVTIAARMLKKAGLIDYTRGLMTITDRAGLKEASCECYGSLQNELGKLFSTHHGHG
jgi:CRP-like cAMP-binding protein